MGLEPWRLGESKGDKIYQYHLRIEVFCVNVKIKYLQKF